MDHILAATDVRGDWHFGIGDPTPVGWLTVFAYLAATLACGRVWLVERRAARSGQPGSPIFWIVLTILLLLLGINKQLDLQTLLNDVGRRMAKAEGWYGVRRYYQVVFIAFVSITGLLTLGVFSWLARKAWKRNFGALLGVVFLYVFVLTRASSIHHVDMWLQWRVGSWKWNWILELGGISVTLVGALMAMRRRGPSAPAAGPGSPGVPDDAIGARRYTFERGVLVPRSDGGSRPPKRGR